jgi:hypothetical protein
MEGKRPGIDFSRRITKLVARPWASGEEKPQFPRFPKASGGLSKVERDTGLLEGLYEHRRTGHRENA